MLTLAGLLPKWIKTFQLPSCPGYLALVPPISFSAVVNPYIFNKSLTLWHFLYAGVSIFLV
jgi:hypothetical protein